jgi:hypothetical protein
LLAAGQFFGKHTMTGGKAVPKPMYDTQEFKPVFQHDPISPDFALQPFLKYIYHQGEQQEKQTHHGD